MTISKKLTIIITCALGVQFAAEAYNKDSLRTEISQVLDFASELYKQNTPEATKIAEWLNHHIEIDQYDNTCLRNQDVIAIATIFITNTTIDTKLPILSKIVAKCEQRKFLFDSIIIITSVGIFGIVMYFTIGCYDGVPGGARQGDSYNGWLCRRLFGTRSSSGYWYY